MKRALSRQKHATGLVMAGISTLVVMLITTAVASTALSQSIQMWSSTHFPELDARGWQSKTGKVSLPPFHLRQDKNDKILAPMMGKNGMR